MDTNFDLNLLAQDDERRVLFDLNASPPRE